MFEFSLLRRSLPVFVVVATPSPGTSDGDLAFHVSLIAVVQHGVPAKESEHR